MGAVLEGMFVKASTLPGGVDCCSDDPEYCEQSAYGVIQVLGLAAVYAGVLSHGSRLISDGAELLQVVPSLQHLVGSIVLPVLGTVPDCARTRSRCVLVARHSVRACHPVMRFFTRDSEQPLPFVMFDICCR